MPLVLVQNERTVNEKYEHWKNVTGEQYHFPNQYKNRIVPGTPFVYYQGTRRADRKPGTPEYFGCGVIGEVWRDDEIPKSTPKNQWAWFCEIDDYLPFKMPVPSKQGDEYIEEIHHHNLWGVGVRKLSMDAYDRIIELAGLANVAPKVVSSSAIMPTIDKVEIPSEPENSPLLLQQTHTNKGEGGTGRSAGQYSRSAKQVGDRAEEIVYKYLRDQLSQLGGTKLRWVAQEGEKPGWDIEYINAFSELTAIEVKGTGGAAFPSVELTKNEWDAAQRLGERYQLFLVADCLGLSPKIQIVENPAEIVGKGLLSIEPVRWRLASNLDHIGETGIPRRCHVDQRVMAK